MREREKVMVEKVRVMAVPCEVYSRIVGYFRPVSNWNFGKQKEFDERKCVKLETMVRLHCGCGA